MQVKKYKTFEEASRDLWVFEPDKKYYKKLKNLFAFWSSLTVRKNVKGIEKFKSYQELLKKRPNGTSPRKSVHKSVRICGKKEMKPQITTDYFTD